MVDAGSALGRKSSLVEWTFTIGRRMSIALFSVLFGQLFHPH